MTEKVGKKVQRTVKQGQITDKETQLTVAEEKSQSMIGRTITVLVDGFDTVAEVYYGRSEADAPDVDGKVFFRSKRRLSEGDFVSVYIEEALDFDLIGTVTE